MELNFRKVNGFPPLAWIAQINKDITSVMAGASVEQFQNGFVEGAWNSDFCDYDFINSDWFCGTGAVIKDDCIAFSTPTHVTYGIYSLRTRGGGTP